MFRRHQVTVLRGGRALFMAVLASQVCGLPGALAADAAMRPVAATAAHAGKPIATVGGETISFEEFERALGAASRAKFYHGQIPDDRVAALQREVAGELVDNLLLLREARRRGLKPDAAAIDHTMAGYDERYKDSAQWKANRAVMAPQVRRQLERQSLLDQLSKSVREVGTPDIGQVRKYYEAQPARFTEPEQARVSVILLHVDPSSPTLAWTRALAEGEKVVAQLRGGANFAELARLKSADDSASRGGDMGYLHQGMLAEPAQAVVDKLTVGQVSEPVRVLQGVAVFRLDERKAATLAAFESVQDRARDLLQRERSEQAWQVLLARLRKDTRIVVDESRMLPLAAAAGAAAPAKPRPVP